MLCFIGPFSRQRCLDSRMSYITTNAILIIRYENALPRAAIYQIEFGDSMQRCTSTREKVNDNAVSISV